MFRTMFFQSFRTAVRTGIRLVAWTLVLVLPPAVPAAVPEISRVQGGNTKTIWGVGFTPGQTEVWDWKTPFDADAALAALRTTPYDAARWLPAEPPPGSRRVKVLDAEPRGLVMAVESESHYSASGFYDARGVDATIAKVIDRLTPHRRGRRKHRRSR